MNWIKGYQIYLLQCLCGWTKYMVDDGIIIICIEMSWMYYLVYIMTANILNCPKGGEAYQPCIENMND